MESMQAILLATGETTALQPLTDAVPSPMLPLLNRPIMSYQVERLVRYHLANIGISVYHLADQIERYFGGGERWNAAFKYLLQPEPLGTAGALKWAEHSLRETFICMPGNALHEINLQALLERHAASGFIATAAVTRQFAPGAKPYHCDNRGRIDGIGPARSRGATWYDTGLYAFDPRILDFIPKRTPFDIYEQLIARLLDAGIPVGMHELEGLYRPVDSFRSYLSLQQELLRDGLKNPRSSLFLAPDCLGRQISAGVWAGRNSRIHPGAQLKLPVMMAENCFIGSGVQLGPNTVLGSDVVIDDGAMVTGSVVLNNTYVGRRIKLENYIVDRELVIDSHSDASLRVTDPVILNDTLLSKAGGRLLSLIERTAAFCLLVLLAPLLVFLAAWLWLFRGPVFTRRAYVCRLHKSKSAGQVSTIDAVRLLHFDAARPYCRWIERLEWDRLPAFWNVFTGKIRLVGLSLVPVECAGGVSEIDWHLRRKHSPGLTGLWYVQSSKDAVPDDRTAADAYYFATRSFWKDIAILARTPFAWARRNIRRPNAGVVHEEVSHAADARIP